MFEKLIGRGFQVDFSSHAEAILDVDFPEVASQLEAVLLASTIPIEEIIGSGGGETKGTQRLRNALAEDGWRKHIFIVQRIIDGVERERKKNPIPFRDAWVDHFVGDKFGAATTHWSKLQDRVQRGVGNPCPLVLIGLPESIVAFGEDPAEVKKLLEEGEDGSDTSE
jgi:hypothetical protein